MIGYASNTRTRRNLETLEAAGWRILLTPENPLLSTLSSKYGIDNGAWGCFRRGVPFEETPFLNLVAAAGNRADFIVLPDIVSGGMDSFRLSASYTWRIAHPRLLLPVQDGMEKNKVVDWLEDHSNVGIFIGGSTEYKLKYMREWGMVASELGRYLHVGRVNSQRRIRLCAEAGADSFDGTSVTRFSCNLPMLEAARIQPSLLSPTWGKVKEQR